VATFTDVPSTFWAYGYVETAYGSNGYNPPGDGPRLTEGCHVYGTIKYFCPVDWCTRREMAVFLTRAFSVPPVPTGWADPW